MITYCKAYPHHVKELIDSGNRNFKAVPLAGDVGESDVLPSLSIFLQVILILYTPWTRVDDSSMHVSFCCDKALSISLYHWNANGVVHGSGDH
jgi:hypothetical protein